jgi:hypothetical protein
MRNRKVEIWTPAEKTRRNFRMKQAWGQLFGFVALGVPAAMVATACGIREAYLNESRVPDPDKFTTELFKRSERVALAVREKEMTDDC